MKRLNGRAWKRKALDFAIVGGLFASGSVLEQHNVVVAQVIGSQAGNSVPATTSGSPEPFSPTATILNSRSFSIPFNVDARGAQPAKVQLFVGRGAGAIQWQLFDEAQPDVQNFQFTAPEDGVYFFTTRTIDTRGQVHSPGNMLEVVVDTVGPEMRLDAQASDSGRVDIEFEVSDRTSMREVRFQYMTDSERVWKPIQATPATRVGRLSFNAPGAWDQVAIHATVIDAAGNERTHQKIAARPRVASVPDHRFAHSTHTPTSMPQRLPVLEEASPHLDPAQMRATPLSLASDRVATSPVPGFSETEVQPVQWPIRSLSKQRLVAENPAPESVPLPPPASPAEISNTFELVAPGQINPAPPTGPTWSSVTPPAETAPAPRPRTPAEAMRPLDSGPTPVGPTSTGTALVTSPGDPNRAPAKSEYSTLPTNGLPANVEEIPLPEFVRRDPAPAPYSAERSPTAPLSSITIDPRTPVRFSDSAKFSLEYELEAIGADGVETVELWGSTDGGQNWSRWGADPDRQSPFDIETKGPGTYAFCIVVISRTGLASPRPLAGDPADIAVIVDDAKPEVKITGTRYGEGNQIGSLVIEYLCRDTYLLERPVALSFSESPAGPWTTIAAGLSNDGIYAWPADPQLPRQFYLRIDATDNAGNVGTYILDQPVESQGLAPRARIRGFQSITGASLPVPGEQTATRPAASFK